MTAMQTNSGLDMAKAVASVVLENAAENEQLRTLNEKTVNALTKLAIEKTRMGDESTLAHKTTFQRGLAHHEGMWRAAWCWIPLPAWSNNWLTVPN